MSNSVVGLLAVVFSSPVAYQIDDQAYFWTLLWIFVGNLGALLCCSSVLFCTCLGLSWCQALSSRRADSHELTGHPELCFCRTHQRIVVSVVEGRRPSIPQNCPLAYSLLIQECWHQDHTERPSFQQIFNRLTEMMSGWSQCQDSMFQMGLGTPLGLDSCQSLESIRLTEPRGLSWWSNDFDHRGSLSSEGKCCAEWRYD